MNASFNRKGDKIFVGDIKGYITIFNSTTFEVNIFQVHHLPIFSLVGRKAIQGHRRLGNKGN